jgi:hypothetical protein
MVAGIQTGARTTCRNGTLRNLRRIHRPSETVSAYPLDLAALSVGPALGPVVDGVRAMRTLLSMPQHSAVEPALSFTGQCQPRAVPVVGPQRPLFGGRGEPGPFSTLALAPDGQSVIVANHLVISPGLFQPPIAASANGVIAYRAETMSGVVNLTRFDRVSSTLLGAMLVDVEQRTSCSPEHLFDVQDEATCTTYSSHGCSRKSQRRSSNSQPPRVVQTRSSVARLQA